MFVAMFFVDDAALSCALGALLRWTARFRREESCVGRVKGQVLVVVQTNADLRPAADLHVQSVHCKSAVTLPNVNHS